MNEWTCTIPTAPLSMKNNYRIVMKGSKRGIQLTPEAQANKNVMMLFMKSSGRGCAFLPEDKVRAVVLVRYADNKRDVDVAIVMDALQDSGIIPNDRQIREITAIAQDATGEPETQIRLERIGQLPWR